MSLFKVLKISEIKHITKNNCIKDTTILMELYVFLLLE